MTTQDKKTIVATMSFLDANGKVESTITPMVRYPGGESHPRSTIVFDGPRDPVLDFAAQGPVDHDPIFDVASEGIMNDGTFADFPISPLSLKM